MEKRNIIIGISIIGIILAILITSYLLSLKTKISEETLSKIKELEISLEKNVIKNIAGFYQKYEKIDVDYYYKENYCFDIFDATIKRFNGLINLKVSKKLKKIDI